MTLRQGTDRAARAAVYIQAAKRLEDGGGFGACTSIIAVSKGMLRQLCIEHLRDWYEKDAQAAGPWRAFWAQNFADNMHDPNELEVTNARVLMLCFMAAITERP